MRIALLGLGELILRIADHFHAHPEHHVAAVARARRPVPEGAALLEDWAAAQGVPTVGHHRELPSDLDLVLCARYGRILRRPFLTRQRRVLNLHSGPLPEYRGIHTIAWALHNREQTHGVTLHEVTEGIDEGPILAQVRFSIYAGWEDVAAVRRKSDRYGWALFLSTIEDLDRITPQPQDHASARFYSRADAERAGLDIRHG